MKKSVEFLKNVVLMTGCSFLLRTVGLSFSVYLSNRIGAEAMGIYHLILSVYFFAVTLATSGIGLTVTKLVSEELAKNNREAAYSFLRKAIKYCLLFSVCAGILLIILAPILVANFFGGKITVLPFYALATGLPFLSVSSALSGYFIAFRKSGTTGSGQILEQLAKIGLILWFLSFVESSDFNGVCCALVLGGTLSEIISCGFYYMSYRLQAKKYPMKPQRGQWKRIFGFSMPVALSSYLRSGLSSVKQLLIPKRLAASGVSNGVAEYGRVNGMVFPILMFPQALLSAVASLIVPEITEKHTLGQRQSLRNILSKIFQITLLFSVAVAGILFRFCEKLCVFFYGNTDTALFLKLLSPLVIIMYLDDIVDAILKGINCQVTVVRINILDSAMGIVLLWWLLPIYGIRGYLTVIAVGEILNGTLSIITLIRHTDCDFGFFKNIVFPGFFILISTRCAEVLCFDSLWGAVGMSVLIYLSILFATGILKYDNFSCVLK